MAEVRPFRAVRYDERRAGPLETLVAPPYDVIDADEREQLRARSPYNVVRLTLPDAEEEAAREWRGWLDEGVLCRDDEPAFWWLAQEYVGPDGVRRTREGLVASLRVEPYERRVVLPHERTHAGPKEGRMRLLRAVRAQLEPIFVLHEGRVPAERPGGEPTLQAEGAGALSRLWRLSADDRLTDWFADRQLLIADGHHRYETALAFHAEDGSEESAYILAVLVSIADRGLEIFPTHRVARRIAGLDGAEAEPVDEPPEDALRRLADGQPGAVLHRPGETLVLRGREPEPDAAFVERLGLEDVSYTPYAEEALARVERGEAGAAVLLRPAPIEQVLEIARRGETMPQKSTYFYPKLLSGLLFHPL